MTESMLAAERASWNQERITLQMSLDHAEREVDRLKGDLRAEQHRALRLTHSYSSESDTDKVRQTHLGGALIYLFFDRCLVPHSWICPLQYCDVFTLRPCDES